MRYSRSAAGVLKRESLPVQDSSLVCPVGPVSCVKVFEATRSLLINPWAVCVWRWGSDEVAVSLFVSRGVATLRGPYSSQMLGDGLRLFLSSSLAALPTPLLTLTPTGKRSSVSSVPPFLPLSLSHTRLAYCPRLEGCCSPACE